VPGQKAGADSPEQSKKRQLGKKALNRKSQGLDISLPRRINTKTSKRRYTRITKTDTLDTIRYQNLGPNDYLTSKKD